MIFINGRFLTQPATGVQRFARELLQALDSLLSNRIAAQSQLPLKCLIPPDAEDHSLPNWKNIQISKVGRLNGNVWEQFELPFYARSGLLINLCNIGPVFHNRQIVVLHDASVFAIPEAYSIAFRAKYRWIMWILARTAKKVFAVSQFSKKELARYLNVPEERFDLISEGCEHILRVTSDPSILLKNNLRSNDYFLVVGSSSIHKNLVAAIEAVEANPQEAPLLVVAGGNFSKVFSAFDRIESAQVLHLGYVTNEQLRALYENATGFIFPSLYEGFGLPPLEAMICGCPVICSNAASLPEVCGDAALYFDPKNSLEIIAQINKLVDDTDLQARLRERGLKQARQYTWDKAARQLAEVIFR